MRTNPAMLCGSILLLLVIPTAARAQSAPASIANQQTTRVLQELRLKDGSVMYGYIEASEPNRVMFMTLSGTPLDIDRAQIASLEPAKGRIVRGEFQPADSNTTRLFFAPTGRTLRRGEAYVGVYEFMLPFAQVGLTDRISVGAGTPLIFGGGGEHPFWVTPKVQVYQHGRFSEAVGILHFLNVGDGNFGIAYAVTTYGESDNALTGGLGYAYARYDEEHAGTAIGMIGGEHRLTRRIKLISENYLWQSGGIVSIGVRFLGERLSADVGLFSPIGSGIAAPVVNFVYKF